MCTFSFSSLSIFKTVVLKSLFHKSDVWASSGKEFKGPDKCASSAHLSGPLNLPSLLGFFFFFWHALSFRYLKKQRFQMQQESSSFTLSHWVWMLHSKYESTKFHKTLGNLRQSNTLFLITEERLNNYGKQHGSSSKH